MLNARHIALVGLVLLGCDKEEGRSDTVRLFYFDGLAQHGPATIDGAAEILGFEIIVAPTPRRSVMVFYWPGAGDGYTGESANADVCGRALWVDDDAQTLAHELGHALYLEHVDSPEDNLMVPGGVGEDLTDDQVDTMRRAAWLLETECPE